MIMININNFIQEKLKINSQSQVNTKQNFTDEELRDDYERVKDSFSKSEKLPFIQKYDVDANKIEVICQKILELLRENRHNKKKYDENDVHDFYRMNIPDTPYKNVKDFFDKEPIEFIEYLKSYFENESQYFRRAQRSMKLFGYRGISVSDRHQINMYNNVEKYLEENK